MAMRFHVNDVSMTGLLFIGQWKQINLETNYENISMVKYCVIAKSQIQGRIWIDNRRCVDENFNRQYPSPRDIMVVTRPEHLRGCMVEHGILLEGWKEIPDIQEILTLANIHAQGRNVALKNALQSVSLKVRPTPKLRGMRISSIIIDEMTNENNGN